MDAVVLALGQGFNGLSVASLYLLAALGLWHVRRRAG